jgi:hypothetical protein
MVGERPLQLRCRASGQPRHRADLLAEVGGRREPDRRGSPPTSMSASLPPMNSPTVAVTLPVTAGDTA